MLLVSGVALAQPSVPRATPGATDAATRERMSLPQPSRLAQRNAMSYDDVYALFDLSKCSAQAVAETGRPMGFAQALRLAVCASVGVRQGDGLIEQSRAVVDRADAAGQPGVTVSAGPVYEHGKGVVGSGLVNLNWVLFDFGGRSASQSRARVALAAALDEQRAEVLLAVGQAAQLFSATQATLGRLGAAVRNLQIAQESLTVADARASVGAVSVTDRLQARTNVEQSQLEHARAQNAWYLARGAMNVALGLPAARDTSIEFEDEQSLFAQDIDLDAMVVEARERHPSVVAARARVQESLAQAESVRSQRWGTISLDASAGRTRQTSDVAGSRFGNESRAGVVWSIPLADRSSISAGVRDALGQSSARRAVVDDVRRRIELQVWQEGRSLLGEIDAVRASRAVLSSAENALRAATERYRAGVGGFSDVLVAQTTAAVARFQSVEAVANAQRAAWRLAAAVGRAGPLAPM